MNNKTIVMHRINGIASVSSLRFKEYIYHNDMIKFEDRFKVNCDTKSIATLHMTIRKILELPSRKPYTRSDFFCLENIKQRYMTREDKNLEKRFYEELPDINREFPGIDIAPDVFCLHHGLRDLTEKAKSYVKSKDIIDGGAYNGDSAIMLHRYYTPRVIHSFDISSENCKKYISNMNKFKIRSEKYVINNIGLGDCSKKNLIDEIGGAGQSLLTRKGNTPIQLTTVDEYVFSNNYDIKFIKFDLEGYGVKALSGSIETIKKFNPICSLAVYHSPEELFETKDLFDKFVNNYKFFLQHQSLSWDTIWGTVLLAVPNDLI